MVLEHLGVVKTERELRALTDSEFDSEFFPGGATGLLLVQAARDLGFPDSNKQNLQLHELRSVLIEGHFPIVNIAIRLQPGTPLQSHYVVVTEISEQSMNLLDPVRGEMTHSVDEFEAMWRLRRGLTILIS